MAEASEHPDGAERPVVQRVSAPSAFQRFKATDHLGSTSLTSDENGNQVARQGYYPYGGVRWSSGTFPTEYGFTGQRWQQSLGLYDYQARYYDPAVGRFISADTVVPGTWNR
ncbi:MAG: hypothetical protein DRI79_13780 [Chloroflexi bacterium]|nr:MAG: hypothetical protein DRI79_13780 [Chloroflexota bacterium]